MEGDERTGAYGDCDPFEAIRYSLQMAQIYRSDHIFYLVLKKQLARIAVLFDILHSP